MILNQPKSVIVQGNAVKTEHILLRTHPYGVAVHALINPPRPRWEKASTRTIEAHAQGTHELVETTGKLNPFLRAVYLAFITHLPLALSPDMIWLLIAQGFARHVNENAEAMRSQFVTHEGQKTIEVRRDEFVRGFAGNDWEGVFSEFSAQIGEIVGDARRALIVPSFSTTGIVERAAFEGTLMDAMQSYFDYVVTTRCGIPHFSIEGTVEDWEQLRASAARLEEFGLDWWLTTLLPILDRFVEAAQGKANPDFWSAFFKEANGSGGPYLSGHIAGLFPYIVNRDHQLVRNQYLAVGGNGGFGHGLKTSEIPTGLSVAPFLWKYLGQDIPMEFVAGFVGVRQNEATYALRPEIGWAVCEQ